jgi:hypothetical protein
MRTVDRMRTRGGLDRALIVALLAIVLAGCATTPPTPITNVSELAGNWLGTITMGFNGPQHFYYLTIHPDGSMVAQWGPNWQWGKITLEPNGGASFEVMDRIRGPLYYYAGPGGRMITMKPLFDEWYVQVRPAG